MDQLHLTRVIGLVPALLSAFALPVKGSVVDAQTTRAIIDPVALYGNEIRFDVLRNGQAAGWHRIRFDRDLDNLRVSAVFHLSVELLFIPVYRFRYESKSLWRHGLLDRLTVRVDDDGTHFSLEAVRDSDRLTVRSRADTDTVDGPIFPTNHWHSGVLVEKRVLNTLTGRVNRVDIRPDVRETVPTERGDVVATRFSYTGDLETEVWYDDNGRWVKMRFKGRDGSTIDYVCRRCQGDPMAEVQR